MVSPIGRMSLLLSGGSGLIGRAIERGFCENHALVTWRHQMDMACPEGWGTEQADIADLDRLEQIVERFRPNIVIHCAVVAHQRVEIVVREDYFVVNRLVTENLARAATAACAGDDR